MWISARCSASLYQNLSLNTINGVHMCLFSHCAQSLLNGSVTTTFLRHTCFSFLLFWVFFCFVFCSCSAWFANAMKISWCVKIVFANIIHSITQTLDCLDFFSSACYCAFFPICFSFRVRQFECCFLVDCSWHLFFAAFSLDFFSFSVWFWFYFCLECFLYQIRMLICRKILTLNNNDQ